MRGWFFFDNLNNQNMTVAELRFLESVPEFLRSIAKELAEINKKLDNLNPRGNGLDRKTADRRDSSE